MDRKIKEYCKNVLSLLFNDENIKRWLNLTKSGDQKESYMILPQQTFLKVKNLITQNKNKIKIQCHA